VAPIPRFAKVFLALIGIALLATLGYLAYGYRNLKLQSEAAARTRAQLEVKYQIQLVEYQRELPVGMPRSEVRKYLDAHRIAYNEWPHGEIRAPLGDEPDFGVCDSWRVYLSLEFIPQNSLELVPQNQSWSSPLDRLAGVSLNRIGHCL
jgi:hypothetical protein